MQKLQRTQKTQKKAKIAKNTDGHFGQRAKVDGSANFAMNANKKKERKR